MPGLWSLAHWVARASKSPTPTWALADTVGGTQSMWHGGGRRGGGFSCIAGSSSSCQTKASCSGQGQEPFLIVEQTTDQALSSRTRGRAARGLCPLCSIFLRLAAVQGAMVEMSTFLKSLPWSSGGVIFSTPTVHWPCSLATGLLPPSLLSGLWTDGHLPTAAIYSSSNTQVIMSGRMIIVPFSPCTVCSVSKR